MDCSAALAGLLLLVVAVLALAALLASRASAAKLTALAAEVERLRELVLANGVTEAPAAPKVATAPRALGAPVLPPPPAIPDLAASSATAAPASNVTVAPAMAATRRTTFEELVGARLQVWIGAMALALAGAFLVKISFERGWISPPVRVATGVAFGIVLLALAEGLRRSSGRISEALRRGGVAHLVGRFPA